jgi:hypothetical protein
MQFLAQLWLPILLSAVAVFILSALFHTVVPFHHREWGGLSNEDAVADALRASNPAPGLYTMPFSTVEGMKNPEWQAKLARGPVAFITVMPKGMRGMGPMLFQSLIYNIVVAVFVAYVASHTVAAGAEYLAVFRVTGTVTFMAYALGQIPDSVWFGRPWKSYGLIAIDALVYSLVTAGIFGWRWV